MKYTLKLIVTAIASGALFSCNNQNAGYAEQEMISMKMDSLEAVLRADPDISRNMKAANDFIKEAERFYAAAPGDSLAVVALFKAGEVARAIGQQPKAIELLTEIWVKNTSHRLASKALFLQGFTYDNDLRDSAMAVLYYQEFLKRYPDDEVAPQVKALIEVVGKSPDELVRSFMEKDREEE